MGEPSTYGTSRSNGLTSPQPLGVLFKAGAGGLIFLDQLRSTRYLHSELVEGLGRTRIGLEEVVQIAVLDRAKLLPMLRQGQRKAGSAVSQ